MSSMKNVPMPGGARWFGRSREFQGDFQIRRQSSRGGKKKGKGGLVTKRARRQNVHNVKSQEAGRGHPIEARRSLNVIPWVFRGEGREGFGKRTSIEGKRRAVYFKGDGKKSKGSAVKSNRCSL